MKEELGKRYPRVSFENVDIYSDSFELFIKIIKNHFLLSKMIKY